MSTDPYMITDSHVLHLIEHLSCCSIQNGMSIGVVYINAIGEHTPFPNVNYSVRIKRLNARIFKAAIFFNVYVYIRYGTEVSRGNTGHYE